MPLDKDEEAQHYTRLLKEVISEHVDERDYTISLSNGQVLITARGRSVSFPVTRIGQGELTELSLALSEEAQSRDGDVIGELLVQLGYLAEEQD